MKPRKISKSDSEIHSAHAYVLIRQTLPPFAIFGVKFRSAPPTEIKNLNDDIKLFKTELWDDFCSAEEFHFAES